MANVVYILQGTTSWTVPGDWNSSNNTIECIGAGGGGGGNSIRYGGGGGGYSKISNLSLTPGNSITVQVGLGGAAGAGGADGTGGTDTYFNGASLAASSVGAKGGNGGTPSAGAGGLASSGIGTTKYSGGNGDIAGSGTGGGGGAAGPNGAGANSSSGTGGQGDNGHGGAGGGANTAGTAGTEFDASHGCGGGGGPGTSGNGQAGGLYGAGGGPGNSVGATGGAGTNGLIVITYLSISTKYWVGGTGTWDASTTTNWADSSGGAGGAAVPSPTNPVVFNGSSGSGTATLSADTSIVSLDFTGYTGTFAGSNALTINGGNFTFASGMTVTFTGALSFTATTTGNTITMNGKTISSTDITFNGSGGAWTLEDAITAKSITITLGSVTALTQNITLTGTGTPWNMNGGTFTPGTSTIILNDATSASKTFGGGGKTYYNLQLTGSGTGTFVITGSNTFNDFKCDTPPHTIQFTAGTTQTLNTFTVNGTSGNLMTLQSTTNGSRWYLIKSPAGQISCDYLSLQDSWVS